MGLMRVKVSRRRGRPRGRYRSSADFRLLQYLVLVSTKFGVDREKFFDGFVDAWRGEESRCGGLLIRCRRRMRDYAVFLVTNGSKVVAQFRMPKRILGETNPLEGFAPVRASRRAVLMGDEVERRRIVDLVPGMSRVNLRARVLRVPKPISVTTRLGGFAAVTNASITDESGVIQLALWNKQIDAVSVGDLIQVENGRVVAFRGERQLRISRGGRLSVVEK